MQIVLAYIKFLLRSTNQHGVHSPFVYNLVTKCFYDRKKYPSYAILKDYRKSLLKDKRKLYIKDFGAGSRIFKSEEREVSKMAKNVGIPPNRARLLNRLVRYLEVDRALELGTSLGLGTAAMAAGNKVKITTIEGCPETATVAKEKFKEFGFENIQLKLGKFEDLLEDRGNQNPKSQIPNSNPNKTENRELTTDNSQPATGNRQQERNSKFQIPNPKTGETVNPKPTTENSQPATGHRQQEKKSKTQIPNSNSTPTDNSQLTTHNRLTDGADLQSVPNPFSILNTKYSLLYIDGNHQKEATLSFFEKLLPTVHNDSVMIFDDIHWSAGMEEAWEEIKTHPQVRVTIDTFQWGLVFFRREQEKEHFIIRI
uniref:O-methyltransferase n=1 Tax=Salinimicrobium xinjiangense TaxID=438596 RepID=UPI00041A8132|nr:class I SAM-dependent methyltransferase [Salinimicrobium xinjiangense]